MFICAPLPPVSYEKENSTVTIIDAKASAKCQKGILPAHMFKADPWFQHLNEIQNISHVLHGKSAFPAIDTVVRLIPEMNLVSQVDSSQLEIRSYAEYAPRWDGYRAPSFRNGTILATQQLLTLLSQVFLKNQIFPDDITPGPVSDGSITLEITKKERTLFFIVNPDDKQTIQIQAITVGGVVSDVVSTGKTDLEKWMDWLMDETSVPFQVA